STVVCFHSNGMSGLEEDGYSAVRRGVYFPFLREDGSAFSEHFLGEHVVIYFRECGCASGSRSLDYCGVMCTLAVSFVLFLFCGDAVGSLSCVRAGCSCIRCS